MRERVIVIRYLLSVCLTVCLNNIWELTPLQPCSDTLLFCAPEADFFERIVAVIVDEAHCVSKW